MIAEWFVIYYLSGGVTNVARLIPQKTHEACAASAASKASGKGAVSAICLSREDTIKLVCSGDKESDEKRRKRHVQLCGTRAEPPEKPR